MSVALQGVPIVPVNVQRGYRAGSWLGLLTAGCLWVALYDKSTDVDGLLTQIELTLVQCQRADAVMNPATASTPSTEPPEQPDQQSVDQQLQLQSQPRTQMPPPQELMLGTTDVADPAQQDKASSSGLTTALLEYTDESQGHKSRTTTTYRWRRGCNMWLCVLGVGAALVYSILSRGWNDHPGPITGDPVVKDVTHDYNCSDPAALMVGASSNRSIADNGNCSYDCADLGAHYDIPVQTLSKYECYISGDRWPTEAVLVEAGQAAMIQGVSNGDSGLPRTRLPWRVDAVGERTWLVLRHVEMSGLQASFQTTAPPTVSVAGGAVYMTAGTLVVEYSFFVGNTAANVGGAIVNYAPLGSSGAGSTRIVECTFIQNTAQTGGALHVWQTGSVQIVNSSFRHNTATGSTGDFLGQGGAMFVNGIPKNELVQISGCDFADNNGEVGGALALSAPYGPSNAKSVSAPARTPP